MYNTDRNTTEFVVKDLDTLAVATVALITAIEAADPAITDETTLAKVALAKTALTNTTSYTAS